VSTAQHGNGHLLPNEEAKAAACAIAEAREQLVNDPARTAFLDLIVETFGELGVMRLANDVVARKRN
jgi:hypothetical protein